MENGKSWLERVYERLIDFLEIPTIVKIKYVAIHSEKINPHRELLQKAILAALEEVYLPNIPYSVNYYTKLIDFLPGTEPQQNFRDILIRNGIATLNTEEVIHLTIGEVIDRAIRENKQRNLRFPNSGNNRY